MTSPEPAAPSAPSALSATLPLLLEFYADKLSSVLRHQAHACLVGQYDANNTYQYIINREEVQLTWVSAAITDLLGRFDDSTLFFRARKKRDPSDSLPPCEGGLGWGGTSGRCWPFLPPTPTLPHKGGGRKNRVSSAST